jgi:hypothetical protein
MVPLPLRRIVIFSLSSIHSYTRTQDRLAPFWLKLDFRQNGLLFDPPTIPNGTFQIKVRDLFLRAWHVQQGANRRRLPLQHQTSA